MSTSTTISEPVIERQLSGTALREFCAWEAPAAHEVGALISRMEATLRDVQRVFRHSHRRHELEPVCPRCLTLKRIADLLS